VKIDIVGAGPAGLYFAALMKRHDPAHRITIHERGPRDATWGFGVVFSDRALEFLRADDESLYAALTPHLENWPQITVVHNDTRVPIAGNGFASIGRLELLSLLYAHVESLGVTIRFGHEVTALDAFADADLVVGASGAFSAIRGADEAGFGTTTDWRPNRFIWYGSTKPFDSLTLTFRETAAGVFCAHHYRYRPDRSTFLVEVTDATWQRAGFAAMDEAATIAHCERVFAKDLDGHPILSNKSAWRQFPAVWNERWSVGKVVLIGDALRTAHFSIGSGTRLAMEDAVALFKGFREHGNDVPAALAAFRTIRQPPMKKIWDAANVSLRWYERMDDLVPALRPVEFAYSYMTRTGRVDHAEMRRRDPALAQAYEALHPGIAGGTLAGVVPWPDADAARFRAAGWWQGTTIGAMVEASAARLPAKVALVDGERRWTYAELLQAARRLAVGLSRRGLVHGDRVLVQLPNGGDFVLAYLALNLIGVIPVMALRAHRHAEVRHFLRASGAVAYMVPGVVGGFDFRTMAAEMQREFEGLRHVIVSGWPLEGQRQLAGMIDGLLSPEEARAELAPLAPKPSDVSTMLLSGGTTSMSKLIPRTHDDYVLNARLCGDAAGFDESTVFMAILPLGHNYNLASPGLLATLRVGGTVVLAPSASADEVFPLVARERVSVVAAVVPLVTAWLNAELPAGIDLSSLKVIQNGGARLAPELRRRLRERFGCTPQEIYGTAEGLVNMTRLDDPDELLMTSSGAPVCEADEIRVVDDDGNDVPDGTPGELVTRGPYTIRGYYDAVAKNAEAFLPGGWYRMGDIVRKQGRHVFTEGRRKDMINRGGEKISCDEIENLMLAHPRVKSAVLVAMADPVFGEKACACIVTRDGQDLRFDELIVHLRAQQIASFKLPERLELMREMPVSPVGKILKRELRDIVAARIAAEVASST